MYHDQEGRWGNGLLWHTQRAQECRYTIVGGVEAGKSRQRPESMELPIWTAGLERRGNYLSGPEVGIPTHLRCHRRGIEITRSIAVF